MIVFCSFYGRCWKGSFGARRGWWRHWGIILVTFLGYGGYLKVCFSVVKQYFWRIGKVLIPDFFVLFSLSEFLRIAFQYFDLDFQNYLRVNNKFIRPNEPQKLCGNASKAQKTLGWEPTLNFTEIIHEMCGAAFNHL